jgi:hypothetical protein
MEKKTLILVTTALVSALSLSGCSAGFDKFEKAYASCGSPDGVVVSDGGKTLSIDTEGEEDYSGATYTDFNCILNAVETPQFVQEQISATSALMGRQTDEFDGIEVSWSFHPDSGAKLTMHKRD